MGTRFTFSETLTSAASPTSTYVYYTPSGTEVKLEEKAGIAPKLYFKFVKSKLTEIEVKKLKSRTKHLKGLLDGTKECGQEGLTEEIEKQIAIAVREQEIAVCGFSKYCTKADIEKFKSRVQDRTIGLVQLEKFPRAIPKRIQTVIKGVKKRGLFDELWILFNNPQREDAKKTSDKIQEKDPILFGKFLCQPDRFYYLVCWIDEYCTITMDEFIKELSKEKVDAEYGLETLNELTSVEAQLIKNRVIQRHKALMETNSNNWKQKEGEQKKLEQDQKDLSELKEKIQVYKGYPWWKRVFKKIPL